MGWNPPPVDPNEEYAWVGMHTHSRDDDIIGTSSNVVLFIEFQPSGSVDFITSAQTGNVYGIRLQPVTITGAVTQVIPVAAALFVENPVVGDNTSFTVSAALRARATPQANTFDAALSLIVSTDGAYHLHLSNETLASTKDWFVSLNDDGKLQMFPSGNATNYFEVGSAIRMTSALRTIAAADIEDSALGFIMASASTTITGNHGADLHLAAFTPWTITSATVQTIPVAATLYISDAPSAGGSVTITNAYGLYVKFANVRFNQTLFFGSDVAVSRGAANRFDLATGDSFRIISGSLHIQGASPGTNGVGVLAIAIGTEPTTSPADTVQLYSVDNNGAGTATLGLRTEQVAAAQVVADSTHTLRVKINGTVYGILLTNAPT